ncbi:zinc finger CCHC domain-containing protein 14 [Pelodytes ibericus]
MVEKQRCPVQRESVYRWFSELGSSQRIEFLCGLLDLCLPLELRFMGSCLEDLARKDYHSLRDSEIRANNPADLGSLTNLTDEVIRSKLLVSLALLGSENREAAGVLCRTLTHIDSIINNYGLQLNDGRTGDEFLLLFTMATNHPAFSFHQKQLLRKELAHIQGRHSANASVSTATTTTTTVTGSKGPTSSCSKGTLRTESPITSVNSLANALHTSAHSTDESLPKRPSGKHSKVTVEKIEVKVLPHKKKEKNSDCCIEVLWSDSSVSLVTKSPTEVTELISKLSHLFPDENLEKCIPYGVRMESYSTERNHMDLELDLRYLVSLPSHVLKSDLVRKFFSNSTSYQQHQNLNPSNTLHVNVNTPVNAPIRPICGVASIQSSQSSTSSHHSSVTLSPCSHSANPGSSTLVYRPSVETTSSVMMSSNVPSPQTQEQQEILEWLRKLRLHKYYNVFSQLSMKKFLSLTEDDLNKFESLTMGAKKKLKTQLELEKEKSEKRCLNAPPCTSFSSSGVARVPPTSHVGHMQSIHCTHSTELSVDVETSGHQMPQEGSSSSEYSSSPSSPMGLQAREESSDSAEEMDRRLGRHLDCGEKEKTVLLVNHFTSSSVRPTAQVLPVQNDTGASLSGHHPLPLQMVTGAPSHMAPIHLMNPIHKLERGNSELKLLQSTPHSLLSPEERGKGSSVPRGGIKIEKSFGNMILDVKGSSSSLQLGQVLSVLPDGNTMQQTVGFGFRAKSSVSGERGIKSAQQPALMVESSSSPTLSSTPVFHVSRTPVKLLVSSADSSLVGQTTCSSVSPAIMNPRNVLYTANTKVAFSAVSGMPGNFCANSTASSSNHASTSFANTANLSSYPVPSSSPTVSSTSETSYYSGSGTTPTVNIQIANQTPHHHVHQQQPQQQHAGCTVCSSCGCSGNCGSGGVTVNYGSYFQNPFSAPSMFPFSLVPFNPVCNNGYMNTQQYSNSTTFPVVHAPYNNSLNQETMLAGQPGFTLPPMQNYMTGTAGVYQPQGMGGSINGTIHKKNGNLSCYNCGAGNHRAQDCKHPSMDFNQQGTFRLKYAPPPDVLDAAD